MKLDDDLDPPEREVTLGTATILGIFLALALVCAAFFGFGYSMGRHSTSPSSAATTEPRTEAKPDVSDSKAASENTSSDDNTDTDTAATPAATTSPPETRPAAPQPEEKVVVHQDEPRAPAPHPVAFPVPTAPAQPAAGGGSIMVQISATSRQGDAEALIGALRQKGYTAAIHHLPDNLYHVQLGPFATRKDAEAMRQRLGTSGYNAILK